MNDTDRTKIKNIKSKIIAMLEERHVLENHRSGEQAENDTRAVLEPSQYWSDFCSFFDYMLGLSEESFAKLRLHTYHLTGDNYQTYYFGDPLHFLMEAQLEKIIKDLPPSFMINEPAGGIGFHYDDGRFLSRDILRYQQVLSTFYRYDLLPIFASTNGKNTRRYVLEIGGGYGGLAHHFSSIYRDVTYIMVDLPETLLFSAAYLSLLNPEKKTYVYERESFQELLQDETLASYDFVLLPNYVLDSLAHLRFDLVINQASFQEMRINQVERYLEFIKKTCRGSLYSWNQDRQSRNKELTNLSDLLRQRFDVIEVPDLLQITEKSKDEPGKLPLLRGRLEQIYGAMLGKPKKTSSKTPVSPRSRYREYICKPLMYSS